MRPVSALFGPDILVNMSVWKDVESLHNYVYRTVHTKIMSRRKEWFNKMTDAYTVLWWIPKGGYPTLDQAKKKLARLQDHGPTAEAFTFKKAFPAPDVKAEETIVEFDDLCPAT